MLFQNSDLQFLTQLSEIFQCAEVDIGSIIPLERHLSTARHPSAERHLHTAAPVTEIYHADGGASANNYLVQTQADISGAPVLRPSCVETTALGAAYLAGLAVGYWKNLEEIKSNWAVDRSFSPAISAESRTERIRGWNKAVCRTTGWAK